MVKPTPEDTALAQRYEAAVRLAREFMKRVRMTQTGLAELLEVNASTLSRFLSGDPQAVPAHDRPGKLQLLDRIEERCSIFSVIRFAPLTLPANLTDDDANLAIGLQAELQGWFEKHQATESVQGLLGAGRLVALVAHAPRPYRTALCADALLYLGHLAQRTQTDEADSELLRRTSERALRLEASGADCVDEADSPEARKYGRHRIAGYAGFVLCFCGIRLRDDTLCSEGLVRLHDAASSSRLVDGHWQNTFLVVQEMCSRALETSSDAAIETARLIQKSADDDVFHVLVVREYPALLDAWRTHAPELVARILQAKESAGA